MAVYFLNLKTFGRSSGSSAVSAAAYRSGERIRDDRSGKTYDHSGRQDILHKEIVLPTQFAGDELTWAANRESLWNTAEAAESRKNARVAREYLVALPAELAPDHRIDLVRGFAHELVERYGFALDVAIHAPRDFPGSDPRNFHAHLLATTREAAIEGLGAKTALEWNDGMRREAGLGPAINELLHVRRRWATATNEALKEAQLDVRIDHRTLQAQGIDREPRPHIPRAAFEMERHGYRSELAERLREEYQARIAAREQHAMQRALEGRLTAEGRRLDHDPQTGAGRPSNDARQPHQNLDDPARQSAENWLRWRETQPQQSMEAAARQSADNWRRWRDAQLQSQQTAHARQQSTSPDQAKQQEAAARNSISRSRDDDYSL